MKSLPYRKRHACNTDDLGRKQHGCRQAVCRELVAYIIIVSLSLMTAGHALAADFTFVPSLTISEEYTDNVFEVESNKKSDYITRTQPGLTMKYIAPFWDWDLAYNYDNRYYARGSRSDDTTHNIMLKSIMKPVDEVLFLDVSDSYKRVSLDVTRDTSNESLFKDQSDQNIGTVSPYIVLRPAANLDLKSGYRYINTWYRSSIAISRQDHVGFLSASYEFTAKTFITTDYTFTREEPESGSSFSRHEVLVGPRYEYADKSYLFAQGGFISSHYDNGRNADNISWKAGISHSLDTATATISAGTSYADDPLGNTTLTTSYNLALTKNFQRGTLTLTGAYREYEDGITEIKKNKSYSGGFSSTLELLPDINTFLALTYENYHDLLLDAYTDKYFVDSNISWLAGKYLTLDLAYKYIDYSSAKIVNDNKRINRLILEAKITF